MMIEEGMTADADSLESTKASISQIEMTFNQLDTQFTADNADTEDKDEIEYLLTGQDCEDLGVTYAKDDQEFYGLPILLAYDFENLVDKN